MDSRRRLLTCVAVAVSALLCFSGVNAATWSYSGASDGIARWSTNYPTCGGARQSPVDLTSAKTDNSLEAFTFSNFDNVNGVSWSVTNNGHSVAVTYAGDTALTVTGGSLGSTYRVYAFHWHWGANDTLGSEHTVNGKAYPMELHVVTYNTKYADFSSCLDKTDGLAVLGFFYEVKDGETTGIEKLTAALNEVMYPGNTTNSLAPVPLTQLIPSSYGNYYRYDGSLTTPSCNEIVTWTVFTETIPITAEQMEMFRKLKDSHGHELVDNFRPAQPIGSREIKFRQENPTGSATLVRHSLVLLLSLLFPWIVRL